MTLGCKKSACKQHGTQTGSRLCGARNTRRGPADHCVAFCVLVLGDFRSILNDAYHDDVVLLYPPYMMALAAIHMACTYVKRDVTDWFDKLTIDHADVTLAGS